MRHLSLILILVCVASWTVGQTPLKSFTNKPQPDLLPFWPAPGIPTTKVEARKSGQFQINSGQTLSCTHESIKSVQITDAGSYWVDLHENQLWSARTSVSDLMGSIMPASVFRKDWSMEWSTLSSNTDERNIEHVRIHQTLAGHPILRQDIVLHIDKGQLRDMNGTAWTGPTPDKLPAPASESGAMDAARAYLIARNVKFTTIPAIVGLTHQEDKASLAWLPVQGNLSLVYSIKMHPNMMDHWSLFVDATTLEIVEAYSELCSIYPEQLYEKVTAAGADHDHGNEAEPVLAESLVVDGPTSVSDQDLLGQSRTVNGYLVGSNFFMVDASRNGMFNPTQSVMPNDPFGVIWTIDAQNTSPQKDNFEVVHATNTNNNWTALEVSAHFNAGESYEYFRTKFNRNSLNGDGGNIISIINVTDENENDMDNAFWGGQAMFYGNGNTSFKPLAQGLDVAGHEMSHGVIQNTANLEYISQSGALNESFADVFGAMIDRNDWQLGEDVVKTSVFPSGALRDLSNPHNGGSGPGSRGWQPQHMNEYQNLPNTPEGDNGGVHVNSGITNRAFFLFATSVGKEKAEQVYYKALRDYLVKSSQFIDMRIAVEKAAADLHGANSAEVTAARSAFDAVGIGAGQGDNHQDDIEVNAGADFILTTDVSQSDLYWVPPGNPNGLVKLNVPAPLSRPSFTDDGSSAVYVDDENNMIILIFDWSQGLSYEAFYLEDNPQGGWRNIAVSKDGTKIAYITADLTNEIWVFDFDGQSSERYILYNPTTAQGVNTGEVLYADALEWDYSGEFIMYDALNRIESAFGDGIEYWDIAFIYAWDGSNNEFTDGQIGKLYTSLPENVSVGNPSFAKNSPYIITFDYVESYFDQFGQVQTDYKILANNIETGVTNEIFFNTTVGYPSYSRLDDQILFTNDNGELLQATIDLQPSDKTLPVVGSAVILVTGAQKGVWFQTGEREFTGIDDGETTTNISIFPQPASDIIYISMDGNDKPVDYTIRDLAGKTILQNKLNPGNGISINALSQGTYFISLSSAQKSPVIARFIKQ